MKMSRILSFCFTSLLLMATLCTAQEKIPNLEKAQNKSTVQQEEATPIQEGVLTDRQRIHSKLYNGRGVSKKIVDILKTQNELNIGAYPPLYGDYPNSPRYTMSDLVDRSTCEADAVIIGNVVSKESQLSDDGFSLFTDYIINVETVLKNDVTNSIKPQKTIIFSKAGGKVGLNGHLVTVEDPSRPRFANGEKYLLFLKLIPITGAFQSSSDIISANPAMSIDPSYAAPRSISGDMAAITELVKTSVLKPCSAKSARSH